MPYLTQVVAVALVVIGRLTVAGAVDQVQVEVVLLLFDILGAKPA
jgi:hypothetical protein